MERLTFEEYQNRTGETAVYREKIGSLIAPLTIITNNPSIGDDAHNRRLDMIENLLNIAYVSLGLGEVGELQGKVKKIIRDSGGVVTIETRKAISKELGDVLWYVSECCNNFGISMDDVAKENLSKLKSRKERGVLEGSGDDR